jgi:uncharacterized protein with HXXEE motif
MMDWLPWAPLAAACCHIFEEFMWPGGFPDWYRRYRPHDSRLTPLMLIVVNVAVLAACINYALVAQTALGAVCLLGISALLCSNGLWHAWASVKTHTVSPGVFTGVLLYVPLLIFESSFYLRAGRAPLWAGALAVLVGGSYHFWWALYHRSAAKRVIN